MMCNVGLFSGCVDESASFPLESVVCEDGSSSVFCLPCGGWRGIVCGGGVLVKYSCLVVWVNVWFVDVGRRESMWAEGCCVMVLSIKPLLVLLLGDGGGYE